MRDKQRILDAVIKKAKRRLSSARAMIKLGNFEDSISRSYYGVLDIIRGLLEIEDIFAKTHKGIRLKFDQLYVQTSKIDKKYSKIISQLEKARGEADYDLNFVAQKEDAESALNQATEFVDLIEKYHNQKKLF